ncbi:MAG: FkbM family methyltransferase [Methanoregulaceae archaeon]|nr:FkbM family methyltransferase [Methanoregulaceae archaeon]
MSRLRWSQGDNHPAGTRICRTRDGILYHENHLPCRQITEVPEYWLEDIRRSDIVIDIGANGGAFALRAARKSSRVIAVEPLTTDLLTRNVLLNRGGIRVLRAALGDGGPVEIAWDGCRAIVPSYPLRDIVRMAGGCDFLKCDCEGAEWLIDPEDLSGIRRIEMELHQPPVGPVIRPSLLDYIANRYEFTIDRNPVNGPYGQMGILHAWRR